MKYTEEEIAATAAVLFSQKRYDDCIKICTSFIVQYPQSIDLHEIRAKAQYLTEKYDEALLDFGWVINHRADNYESAMYYGLISLEHKKDITSAIMSFEHVFWMSPSLGHGEIFEAIRAICVTNLIELYRNNDDVVKTFKLYFHLLNNNIFEVHVAIIMTLDCYKMCSNLGKIYSEFYEFLSNELLKYEEKYEIDSISGAIITLLLRLGRYNEVISFINANKNKETDFFLASLLTAISGSQQWFKYDNEIKEIWQKLANLFTVQGNSDTDVAGIMGRLFYPMKYYLKYMDNPEIAHKFLQTLILTMTLDDNISRIKKYFTVGLHSPIIQELVPHVYQYCSPSKFFNRMFSGRENSTWVLTCADHMNDEIEGCTLYRYFQELGVNIFDGLVGKFGISYADQRSNVFLLSFSLKKDSLEMYEKYTQEKDDEGFGVCVELSMDSFDNNLEDGVALDEYDWMFPLYNVKYADSIEDIDIEPIKNIVKRIAKKLAIISLFWRDLDTTIEGAAIEYYLSLFRMIEEIAYLFKEKKWANETEMRILKCVRGNSDNIRTYEIKDTQGRPYRNYITKKKIVVSNIYDHDCKKDINEYKAWITCSHK